MIALLLILIFGLTTIILGIWLSALSGWLNQRRYTRIRAKFLMPEAPPPIDPALLEAMTAYKRQMRLDRPLNEKEIEMLKKAARLWN